MRERVLQDNASYEELLTLGITKEQSAKGAALLEKVSGQNNQTESRTEEVRRIQKENQRLRARLPKHATDVATQNVTRTDVLH